MVQGPLRVESGSWLPAENRTFGLGTEDRMFRRCEMGGKRTLTSAIDPAVHWRDPDYFEPCLSNERTH